MNLFLLNLEEIIVLKYLLIFFIAILIIGFHIIFGTCLNNINRSKYGEKSTLAWIPFVNIYLLGKLVIEKSYGIVLSIFLSSYIIAILNYIYAYNSGFCDGFLGCIRALFIILILTYITVPLFYVLFGMILSKVNYKIYGKDTVVVWIPFCNFYLLGKILVNKLFGLILAIIPFANFEYKIPLGGDSYNYATLRLIPSEYAELFFVCYVVIIAILFLCLLFKYSKLLKIEKNLLNN